MSVPFLWNKENQQDFLPVIKNLNFFLFLRSIFLVPVFLCSFLIPFTEDLFIFFKSIFNFLLFLIIDLRHMFSRLTYLSAQRLCSVLEVVHNNSII